MGIIKSTYNKFINFATGKSNKEKMKEIEQDPFIIGDAKDVILHLFKHHEDINNNINLSYFDNSQVKQDFVFQQMRLANLMYEFIALSENKIKEYIKEKYLTIDEGNMKIMLISENKKEILELIKYDIMQIKTASNLNAVKIKSILHEDVKNLTLLNRNVKDNPFNNLGFPKLTPEEVDAGLEKDKMKSEVIKK